MKNFIVLIALLVSFTGFAQEKEIAIFSAKTGHLINRNKNYLELRREYKDYCNQIVIDTIKQH
jgi:hypothetical protein